MALKKSENARGFFLDLRSQIFSLFSALLRKIIGLLKRPISRCHQAFWDIVNGSFNCFFAFYSYIVCMDSTGFRRLDKVSGFEQPEYGWSTLTETGTQ